SASFSPHPICEHLRLGVHARSAPPPASVISEASHGDDLDTSSEQLIGVASASANGGKSVPRKRRTASAIDYDLLLDVVVVIRWNGSSPVSSVRLSKRLSSHQHL